MRLTHFALALTIILLGITGYLAWEGQQEIKGLKKERDFERQQRLAQDTASPGIASMAPLPQASITPPPPAPGTIAPAPVLAAPAVAAAAEAETDEIIAGAGMLPGGGRTVPKVIQDAESQGLSTNAMTPLQKQIQSAAPVARIKTVVREQGFIIIDAGSIHGLSKGQKFEVRRANAILAKVTLTDSIDANESVADLDFASIPTGVTLEPGDELIVPVER